MVRQGTGLAQARERIPLGRFGTAEECAAVALMLVGNAYMTGQAVALSGGLSFN
jgi:3-oxoacyl-[acyl-carrier protein] reductase